MNKIARNLSQKGYDLVLVARDFEKMQLVKQGLKTKVELVCMDVSKIENCQKLHNDFKDIDVLINNAGFENC